MTTFHVHRIWLLIAALVMLCVMIPGTGVGQQGGTTSPEDTTRKLHVGKEVPVGNSDPEAASPSVGEPMEGGKPSKDSSRAREQATSAGTRTESSVLKTLMVVLLVLMLVGLGLLVLLRVRFIPRMEDRIAEKIEQAIRSSSNVGHEVRYGTEQIGGSIEDLKSTIMRSFDTIGTLQKAPAGEPAMEDRVLTQLSMLLSPIESRLSSIEAQFNDLQTRIIRGVDARMSAQFATHERSINHSLDRQIQEVKKATTEKLQETMRLLQDVKEVTTKKLQETIGLRKRDTLEARHWIKSYYPHLVENVFRDRKYGSNSSRDNGLIMTLDRIQDHLKCLEQACCGSSRELVSAYLREMREASNDGTDPVKLKEDIVGLIDKWSAEAYFQAQLERDMGNLLNPVRAGDFESDRFVTYDTRSALNNGMERQVREMIRGGLSQNQGTSAEAQETLYRTLRSKIIDLVSSLDGQSVNTNEDSGEAEGHINGILDCLGLEELPLGVNREEFDSEKHVKVKEDTLSRYPQNTVVGVVRRGLRDKAGGTVRAKAHVIVAQRSF